MFEALKKWAAKKALRHIVHKGVSMTHFTIDRHKKTLEAELEFEGEAAPVRLQADYLFEKLADGASSIALSKIHISRPWLQVAAKFTIAGKKIPMPPQIAEFAELIL